MSRPSGNHYKSPNSHSSGYSSKDEGYGSNPNTPRSYSSPLSPALSSGHSSIGSPLVPVRGGEREPSRRATDIGSSSVQSNTSHHSKDHRMDRSSASRENRRLASYTEEYTKHILADGSCVEQSLAKRVLRPSRPTNSEHSSSSRRTNAEDIPANASPDSRRSSNIDDLDRTGYSRSQCQSPQLTEYNMAKKAERDRDIRKSGTPASNYTASPGFSPSQQSVSQKSKHSTDKQEEIDPCVVGSDDGYSPASRYMHSPPNDSYSPSPKQTKAHARSPGGSSLPPPLKKGDPRADAFLSKLAPLPPLFSPNSKSPSHSSSSRGAGPLSPAFSITASPSPLSRSSRYDDDDADETGSRVSSPRSGTSGMSAIF